MFKKILLPFILTLLFSSVLLANLYIESFITLQTESKFRFYHYSKEREKVDLMIYKINENEMIDYLSNGTIPALSNPILKMTWDFEGKKWDSNEVNVENIDYGIYMVFIRAKNDFVISLLSKTRIWGKIIYLKSSAFIKFFDIITGEFLRNRKLLGLGKEGTIENIGETNIKGEIIVEREGNEGKLLFLKGKGVLFHRLEWPSYIDNKYTLSFFTDRPIYKPGDVVNFGGIVRERTNDNEVVIPTGEVAELEIKDPMGRKLYNRKIQLDDFGTFEDSFQTFEEIKRGSYSVNIKIQNTTFYKVFRIEDYIKPKFKVEIFGKDKFNSQKPLKFTVSAKYYYGTPLSNVEFGYSIYIWKNYEKIYYDSGRAKLDSNGKAEISFKVSNITFPTHFTLAVNVGDESGAEVEEEKDFVVYPCDFYLEPDYKNYIQLGEKFHLHFIAKDLNDEPVSKNLLILVKTPTNELMKFFAESDENGKGAFNFLPLKTGKYELEIQDLDDKKTILFKGHFLVYKSYYQTILNEQLRINLLSKKILPGEDLHLELISPFKELNGKLFLAAGNWVKFIDIDFKNGKADIHQRLPDKVLSNRITIFAFAAKAGRKLEVYKNYEISKEAVMFKINVESDRNVYSPGDEVELKIKTEEKEALFFIAVVDKAVLDLLNAEDFWDQEIERLYDYYSNKKFMDFKVYPWEMREFFSLVSKEKTEELLAQIKSSGIALRSNFNDTALWIAGVKTDETGKATLRFKLPDNLTTWKILIIGVDKRGKYASINKEITTTKDVILTPILPEYFLSGDVIKIGAMISNNTSKNQNFKLSCETVNSTFSDELSVREKSRSVVKFVYNVPEVESREIKVKMTAKSLNELNMGDGVLISRELRPRALNREWRKSGIINDKTEILKLSQGKFSGSLSISTDILGILIDSIEALVGYPYGCVEQTMSKFLPTIIYKRLLKKVENKLEFLESEKVDEIVTESLRRLYGFQHPDGGWGWWKDDQTSTFMTAYVMHGFFIAMNEGYDINEDVLKKGLNALKDLLITEKKDRNFYYMLYVLSLYKKNTLGTITLKDIENNYERILYLLADLRNESKNSKLLKTIIKEFNGNDHIKFTDTPYFLDEIQLNALLLLELSNFREDSAEIAKICDRLTNYLISKRVGRMWKNTKQTAFCVLALSRLKDLEQRKIYATLIINGEKEFSGYIEGNLKIPIEGENTSIHMDISGNAYWSVSGKISIPLEDYNPISSKFAISRELQKRISIKLNKQDVNLFVPIDNEFVIQTIETVQASTSAVAVLSYSLINADSSAFVLSDHSLIFNNEYTGLVLHGGLIELKNNELLVKGTLYRDGVQLTNDGIYRLKFKKGQPLKTGDIVRSKIKIFGSGEYVIIEDPIPSAAIPMKNYRERLGRKFFEESRIYVQKEIRKDKVLVFLGSISNFTTIYNYYRIMFSGQFTILPAKIWEMYDTDNFASSEFDEIEVEF
ncbi:MAG: hypothetical protein J7K69_05010 [Thermotogae bacterium]|nr:hypothetical protein [Thermotogota bacterium]